MSTLFTELIPGLPEELALECLTRLDYTTHCSASAVCRRWRSLLHSREFYYERKRAGFTRKAACLVQSQPSQLESEGEKPVTPARYQISLFDAVTGNWERVDPIPKYPDGLPLFCHVVSSEGKLIALGGWDPVSYEPVCDVFIYDFTNQRWAQRANMPAKRSFFAAAVESGRIFVAGGHDESKNALKSAWVYDIRGDTWTELPPMSEERDECQGVVIGSGFWVVSGYGTDSQGSFKNSAEVYDFELGRWARVDDTWTPVTCPRSCVGVGKDDRLFSWSDVDESVTVGTCGVDFGDRVLVSGSGYQGGPLGFYLMEVKSDGVRGKLVKLGVTEEFSGFVQSGCCVEI